jgi:hypothetical protein
MRGILVGSMIFLYSDKVDETTIWTRKNWTQIILHLIVVWIRILRDHWTNSNQILYFFFNHNPLSKHLLVRWLKQSIHWRYSSRISILASVYIFDNRDHNVWIYTGEAYGRFLNFLERVIPVPTLTNCVFGSLNLASGVIRSPNLQTAYLDL